MSWVFNHLTELEEENILDPDDGNSWLCSVCNLPIFSTPFIKSDDGKGKIIHMHDQCANLPEELTRSVVHPGGPLILRDKPPHRPTMLCSNCRYVKCGTKFYSCRSDHACFYKFDVLCALPTSIRIRHRSHEHRLMAVRGVGLAYSLVCGACGEPHPQDGQLARVRPRAAVSYLCHACGFWIHPLCASLPNTIVMQRSGSHHPHPLILRYYRSADSFVRRNQEDRDDQDCRRCAVCGNIVKGLGVYSCIKCRNYCVDIMCADPKSFIPVVTREARFPDLIRLPIPDENTSVVRYIIDSSTSSSDLHDDDQLLQQHLHQHPLILHHHNDNDNDNNYDCRGVCNACTQLISPPFYKCLECPHFFLHNHCANLPPILTHHPAHDQNHTLSLFTKHGSISYSSMLIQRSLRYSYPTNGFIYSCKNHDPYFELDVLSALMPASVTHSAHANTHILYSSFTKHPNVTKRCECCGQFVDGLYYECGTCRNFRLHYSCALLPDSVKHKFDQHLLKLITYKWSISKSSNNNTLQQMFCEICEEEIYYKFWYYSCEECRQSFHVNCIPCLDELSKIKFGVTAIRVGMHECPLSLIRASTVWGYRCGKCGSTINSSSKIAYECFKCCFRIHEHCVEDMLECADECL